MPSRYRRHVPALKAQLVARVGSGARLAAVYGDAGLPGRQTVDNWRRADPAFAAAFARAMALGADRRLGFDEAVAAEFLRRARAGETINALLREPGMPGRRAYRRWIATQPPFCEAIFALRQRRDAEIGRHGRARFRVWDPALGDRIIVGLNRGLSLEAVLAADPALPCRPVVRRWRREQPDFDKVLRMLATAWRRRRVAAGGLRTPAMAAAVLDRIREGASFNSLGREPGMPSRVTLRRWMAAQPGFAAAVAQACADREDWYMATPWR